MSVRLFQDAVGEDHPFQALVVVRSKSQAAQVAGQRESCQGLLELFPEGQLLELFRQRHALKKGFIKVSPQNQRLQAWR